MTVDSSGATKRKFSAVGEDSATGQPDVKVRKTEERTAASGGVGTAASGGEGTAAKDDGPGWVCASCTFSNRPSLETCEKCHSSRNAVELLQKQLDELKQQTSLARPPSNWQLVDPAIRMKLVELAVNDVDYVDISKVMSTHGFQSASSIMNSTKKNLALKPFYQITKIERTENLHMYQMYSMRKEQMKQENGPLVENEQRLWHGTSAECVTNIATYGFNRSHCGKHGTVYGQGVYFSIGPSYSSNRVYATPDKDNLQYMFYSRVLTGRYTVGDKTMVEPPMFENKLGRFNSLANNMTVPSIFVVFHDAQSYPEFLITFKRI